MEWKRRVSADTWVSPQPQPRTGPPRPCSPALANGTVPGLRTCLPRRVCVSARIVCGRHVAVTRPRGGGGDSPLTPHVCPRGQDDTNTQRACGTRAAPTRQPPGSDEYELPHPCRSTAVGPSCGGRAEGVRHREKRNVNCKHASRTPHLPRGIRRASCAAARSDTPASAERRGDRGGVAAAEPGSEAEPAAS